MDKLIVILGPTASGKTALSLRLAKKFRGEIVSADSRQIYRGMDIGTAKSPRNHHLIDIKSPAQSYTFAQFRNDALKAIKIIRQHGKLPFLVGGTGFYLYSLLNNISIPQVPPDPALRKKLQKLSPTRLFAMLKKLDPARVKTVDKNNPHRLIRAIEIAKARTHPTLSLQKRGWAPPLFQRGGREEFLILGIQISKPALRRNVNRRVDAMFRQGLVSEVKNLIKKYGRRKIFSQTIGYREILDYLNKKITLEQAREQIKKNTWHYTKHQYNWFKRLPIVWVKNERQAKKHIKEFLSK